MASLLAFDTSTEVLTVAVLQGDRIFEHRGEGGAAASAALLPAILRLLSDAGLAPASLDAVVFGRGPGSFTGLRTACSVAQGFGWGAGVPVLPIDTLHAVAEDARHRFGSERVMAVLDARMDQVYAAGYDFSKSSAVGVTEAVEPALLAPEQVELPVGWVMAGNAFEAYGERLPSGGARHAALPLATALLRLAPAMLAAGRAVAPELAQPVYVRDKVAQTTQERADAKAAAGGPR
ncbi:tRNA (Adenosine(37)-N6)-threonylcarbamoyltransferase complex dimerization subunit type 1 TsaB [Burkholderiales bacterium 8X]|nr:tRNA (Adenosine(37)-N6)-threonylcarbamoyltransferase complex dimerization subunit type 1 TsaB [Burkholderiales bacterium 8X]